MLYGYNNYGSPTQIIRVNGENGARAFQMAPNSSSLLLDENNPILWLCQTDGAGYKSVTPYKIEPYKPEPAPDLEDILQRLNKLEEKVNEPYFAAAQREPSKQQANADTEH